MNRVEQVTLIGIFLLVGGIALTLVSVTVLYGGWMAALVLGIGATWAGFRVATSAP